MTDAYKPRAMGLMWVATFVTLAVTLVRLLGELQGWDPRWFGSSGSVPGGLFGIVWLVPIFGFLFGRRLAQAGSSPPFLSGFFVPMFAWLLLLGTSGLILTTFEGEELREKLRYVLLGGPVLALLGVIAWPRAFCINLAYAVLARSPVVVVQFLDVKNGWQTHYGKFPARLPAMAADERLWLLGLTQCSFWLPFTVLLGGGFAALGAATVRRA